MNIKKLFTLFFLMGVIFSESKGSAEGLDLTVEDLKIKDENESGSESIDSISSEDLSTAKKKEEKKRLRAQEVERLRAQHLLEWAKKKSPLTLAASRGDVEAIQSLMAGSADVNQKDGEGWTPLMEAASRASSSEPVYQAVVRSLLEGQADVNLIDNEGMNALILSVGGSFSRQTINGDVEVVRLLLGAQADVTKEDNKGCTVLQHAIDCGDGLFDLLAQADVGPHVSNERWQEQIADERGRRERLSSRYKAMECWGLE